MRQRRGSAAAPGRTESRRALRAVGGAVLTGALLMTACDGADETAPETDDEAESEPDPEREQTLTVGMSEDRWAGSEINQKRFTSYPSPNASTCEEPIGLTKEFDLEPRLATDWEYAGDNTFRFELREGVEFTDGTPFDAEAFKEAIDYKAEEPSVTGLSFVEPGDAEVVDEHTVEITPSRRNQRLFEQITHPSWAILSPDSDPLADPESLHCTGPYEVASYEAEEQVTVVRNEEYWDEPGELEEMTFRFFPDDSARLLALEAGEVDAIGEVPRAQVSAVEEMPEVDVVRAPPGQNILVYMALRGPEGAEKPTGDLQVRRAIAHAIDRDAYIEGVLDGEAERVDHVAPPSVLGEHADTVEGVPHDPDEAERLLEEAGWEMGDDGVREKDGERLELTTIYAPDRVDLPSVEFVQAELAEVGIDAQIEQLETAVFTERRNNGEYDLSVSNSNQNNANPAFLMNLVWYSQALSDMAKFIAPGPDSRFDELIEQIHEEDEFEELQRLSAEAMSELVDEEVVTVPLAGTYRIYALHEDLASFDPHPSGINQKWHTTYWTR
jgi:peptide/nickel transport system substrate-binding protein